MYTLSAMSELEKTESRELIPGCGVQVTYPSGISTHIRHLLANAVRLDPVFGRVNIEPTHVDDDLSPLEKRELLATLEKRLQQPNPCRADGVTFAKVKAALTQNPRLLRSFSHAERMGGHMEVTSLSDKTISFDDIAEQLDVAAQVRALKELKGTPLQLAAIDTLRPDIQQIEAYLQVPPEEDGGINYYEFLVLCAAYGLEPMPKDVYASLQERTRLDPRITTCWLQTEESLLQKNVARHGFRYIWWDEEKPIPVLGKRHATMRHPGVCGGRFRIQGNIA